MDEEIFTINLPKDCLKPVGVVYNNDDGTAIVVMHNSIDEALLIQIP